MMIRKHEDAYEPPEETGPFLRWKVIYLAGMNFRLKIAILWVPTQIGTKAGIVVRVG